MKLIIDIPKEFENDFNEDKFEDVFSRVITDCKSLNYDGLTGKYEIKTLCMLIDAFANAVVLQQHKCKLINYYDLLDHIGKDRLDSRELLFEMANKLPVIVEMDKE